MRGHDENEVIWGPGPMREFYHTWRAKHMMIPTVGRLVWFWRSYLDHNNPSVQPSAAIVCGVHNDRMVNLAAFTTTGVPMPMQNVALLQPGDDLPDKGSFAEWMPYQVSKALAHDHESESAEPRPEYGPRALPAGGVDISSADEDPSEPSEGQPAQATQSPAEQAEAPAKDSSPFDKPAAVVPDRQRPPHAAVAPGRQPPSQDPNKPSW